MKTNWSAFVPRQPKIALGLLAALLTTTGSLRAGDLFTLSATSGLTTVNTGANNVVDLIQRAVDRTGPFAGLGNITSGSLTYGGVANAIQYFSPAQGQATIIIPSTGLNKSFTTTAALTDFLKTDGSAEVAKFLKAMAAQSLVTITDGNPGASTARSASDSYQNYGMTFAETKEEKDANKPNTDLDPVAVSKNILTQGSRVSPPKAFEWHKGSRVRINNFLGRRGVKLT